MHRLVPWLFVSAVLFGQASPAAADVLPNDACFVEGETCDNPDGPASQGAMGICQKAQCQRPAAPGEAGAAGDGIIVYDCLRCIAGGGSGGESGNAGEGGATTGGSPSGGAPSGGSSGAGAEPNAGEAGFTPILPSGGCDCSVGNLRADHSLAALMLLSGLLFTRWSRRRR